ncbi:hypothetical protein KUTeg_010750 [Tegillarca granosa]|uniref:SRCR domain-containing protein n=1 Tax=Tegillarca granosa TaxID=220873 RepID=A0ABQ9F581_TEGGR|nr:hypothetical protein KUTeg_010750 [Tegillarca granosa]
MDDLDCHNQYTLRYCSFNGWGNNNCGHGEDVGVVCRTSFSAIRLVGGNNFYEGRVEIYHSGHWGTICDDSFGFNEADVVCKMLGFKGFSQLYKAPSQYGSSHDKIWLDDVRCNGYEPDIANCRSGGWGVNNCGHEEDIWIGCGVPYIDENQTTTQQKVCKAKYILITTKEMDIQLTDMAMAIRVMGMAIRLEV